MWCHFEKVVTGIYITREISKMIICQCVLYALRLATFFKMELHISLHIVDEAACCMNTSSVIYIFKCIKTYISFSKICCYQAFEVSAYVLNNIVWVESFELFWDSFFSTLRFIIFGVWLASHFRMPTAGQYICHSCYWYHCQWASTYLVKRASFEPLFNCGCASSSPLLGHLIIVANFVTWTWSLELGHNGSNYVVEFSCTVSSKSSSSSGEWI